MNKSLYIHIPFCNSICNYCDFCKIIYNQELADQYINSIIKDIPRSDFYTIYIGGGTPSSLSLEQLEKLLKTINQNCKNVAEFSIEINPEDFDVEKFNLFKKYGVNRVSIGVQSFNEKILKKINRKHSKEDVINCINYLRQIGINNISCDLMFGIKGQNKTNIKQDIDVLLHNNIIHISTYALLVEENTYFKIKDTKPFSDETQANQYYFISEYLKSNGFNRYEVSNFAKVSYESKHNLVYWNAKEYVGLGAGASGYENRIRYTYTKSIKSYIENKTLISSEKLSNKDIEYEYIILSLRLKDGVNFKDFKEKFNISFEVKYKDVIDKSIKLKIAEKTDTNFYCKENKMFILNRLLMLFD